MVATFEYNGELTIGNLYYRTEVGAHENSQSPYGTFDQGGNVWEWNEALATSSDRGLRGASYYQHAIDGSMHAEYRSLYATPVYEQFHFGFRVAAVPEPATLSLLCLGGLVLRRRR